MATEVHSDDLTYDSPSAFMNAFEFSAVAPADYGLQQLDQTHHYPRNLKLNPKANNNIDPVLGNQFPSFNLDSNMWGNHGHLNRFDMLNASMSPLDANLSYDTGYVSQEGSPDNKSPPGMGLAAPTPLASIAENKADENAASAKSRRRPKTTAPVKKEPKQTSRKPRRVTKPTAEEESMMAEMEGMDETKREQFLARNREAASKCRQKKKQWTSNLEERARELSFEKQMLTTQAAMLKNELLMLKCKCLEHSNCDCEGIRDYLKHTVTNLPPANASLYSRLENEVAASRKGSLESIMSPGDVATSPESGDEDLDFFETRRS